LANQRIGNEIRFDLPVGGASVVVRVAGGFEADAQIGNRALVSFDTLDVFFLGGGTGATARRLLRAGALFSAVRSLKPALANGADDASWLDTTYISERARLGRGNKGSVFILERSDDTGADAAPLTPDDARLVSSPSSPTWAAIVESSSHRPSSIAAPSAVSSRSERAGFAASRAANSVRASAVVITPSPVTPSKSLASMAAAALPPPAPLPLPGRRKKSVSAALGSGERRDAALFLGETQTLPGGSGCVTHA